MRRDPIVLGLLIALQIQIAAPPVQANPAAGEQSKNVFVLTAGEDRAHWMSPEQLPRDGWLALFDDGKAMRIGHTRVVVLKSEGTGSYESIEVDSKPAGA
jgi:flagellar basal body L-ring protein FlgH